MIGSSLSHVQVTAWAEAWRDGASLCAPMCRCCGDIWWVGPLTQPAQELLLWRVAFSISSSQWEAERGTGDQEFCIVYCRTAYMCLHLWVNSAKNSSSTNQFSLDLGCKSINSAELSVYTNITQTTCLQQVSVRSNTSPISNRLNLRLMDFWSLFLPSRNVQHQMRRK